MPYTTEQLQHVSRRFRAQRRSLYVHEYAERNAIDALRMYESDYQWSVLVAQHGEHVLCENCGEVIGYVEDGETVYRHPDTVVEVDCFTFCDVDCADERDYHECTRCGEWTHGCYAVYIDDVGYYCSESCAVNDGNVRCGHCDEWVNSDWTWNVDGEEWCESCADYHSHVCENCGDRHPDDDMYVTSNGEYYCSYCYDDRDCSSIPSWTWYPRIRLFGIEGTAPAPHLGTELETDDGGPQYEYASALDGLDRFGELFWMGDDGSLSSDGVEIKSQPMTLAYHESIHDLYEEIGSVARRYGYTSHDAGNCGLHISVDREWFGKSSAVQDVGIFKLMRLTQRFERQFTAFSRRTSNYYCNYGTNFDYAPSDKPTKVSVNSYDGDRSVFEKARQFKEHERDKYRAVNIRHADHIEIRIFRGTLRWSTYFASLAMVDGLARAVKVRGSEWVENVTWYELMNEVIGAVRNGGNGYSADCLEQYLAEKELR